MQCKKLLGLGVPVLAATVAAVGVAAASYPVAYCAVIPVASLPSDGWGLHGGEPITGATGSYTRGHGTLDLMSRTTTGLICQVDRVRGAPDRQIVLSVGHDLIYASHTAYMFGAEGNVMKIHVRVKSSTDPLCAVGTSGTATVFAAYNGVHKDSVEYSFPAACSDHRHVYTGASVVARVPVP